MSNKLIYILLDGLTYDVCSSHMGYLHHLNEQGKMTKHIVWGQLPSLSRPLYELLLTGVMPFSSGITANSCNQLSSFDSLFHLCRNQGKTTAAAAYHWVSELYNFTPFSPLVHRMQFNPDMPIQNGIFYWNDNYPDTHLFADANALIVSHKPDFMFVHSMGIDNTGHARGSHSPEYRSQVMAADSTLALYLPSWIKMGYQILVTSDHGMDSDGSHGGTRDEERKLPLFILTEKTLAQQINIIPQEQIASLCCKLADLTPSSDMLPLTAFI